MPYPRGGLLEFMFLTGVLVCEEKLDELERRLRGGERLRLMCHCAPNRCHAEAIARLLIAAP